jgi:uracil-DNA glycosylase family 4
MLDLNSADLEAIFRGDTNNVNACKYPMYPLTSPGMPPAGPSFIEHALAIDGVAPVTTEGKGKNKRVVDISFTLNELYLRALYDADFTLPIKLKGQADTVRLIPGHLWGDEASGPTFVPDELLAGGARVMVVGKMPGADEVQQGRNYTGPSGEELRTTLIRLGVPEEQLNNWYMCNLCRWPMPSAVTGQMPAAWIKDCLPLLHQEFRLNRPDYVLCLGAEATKAVCGQGYSVGNMIGRYLEISVPLHDLGEPEIVHKMKVMAVTHPAAVLRTTELYPGFESALRNFVELIKGNDFAVSSDKSVTWTAVYKERDLAEHVDFILRTPGLKKIAIDGEWHGNHPGEPGSYLRTIQISANGKFAVIIVLRHQGGAPAFAPSLPGAMRQLNRLLDRDDVQMIGSFLAADLPWLLYNGLNVHRRIRVPGNFEEFKGGNYPGVYDVALAQHACNETGDYKLEVMGSRLCGTDRWDVDIAKWKHRYCAENKIKQEDLAGYGEVPDEILYPYSAKDSAISWRLAELHNNQLLDADQFGNECWHAFHVSMQAFPAFNEMGCAGIKVDPQRIDELTDLFSEASKAKLDELRTAIRWPDFNPRSSQQSIEFLFGEQYSTKIDKETGARIRTRPPGAMSLGLRPVKSTGKSKAWDWVEARGETAKYSPNTDKETLGILGARHPLARALRDIRLIDQVNKSVFRQPKRKGAELVMQYGRRVYGGGLGKYICQDSRIRSTFVQVKETGRASSARPNLQALSSKREDDYRRILGSNYKYPVRSCITANDDPSYGDETVLLSGDYKGAELMLMAVLARDATMLDHCRRANLPESDPNYYDMHARVACRSFRLDCEPTKSGLRSIGKPGLRVGAKSILFGIEYGQSAESCARKCGEEGINITVQEAQDVINAIFETYPGIPVLQQALRERANNPCWIRNYFGRMRRCIPTSDRAAMGAMEREFLNFLKPAA